MLSEYQLQCLADLVEGRYRRLYPERWEQAPARPAGAMMALSTGTEASPECIPLLPQMEEDLDYVRSR